MCYALEIMCQASWFFISKNIYKKNILEEHEARIFVWGNGRGTIMLDYIV